MVFDADLDAQFSASDPFCTLGTFATTPTPTAVYGRFIEATETVGLLSDQLEANDPSFEVRTDQVEAIRNDTTVVIGVTTYTVKRKQRLGNGVTLIYLKS